MACTCSELKLNMTGAEPTGVFNLDYDCPEHGTNSPGWNDPLRVAQREAERAKTIIWQMKAKAVRDLKLAHALHLMPTPGMGGWTYRCFCGAQCGWTLDHDKAWSTTDTSLKDQAIAEHSAHFERLRLDLLASFSDLTL